MVLERLTTSPEDAETFRRVLRKLFNDTTKSGTATDRASFRSDNEAFIPLLDRLERARFVVRDPDLDAYRVSLVALAELKDPAAGSVLEVCDRILARLYAHYKNHETRAEPVLIPKLASELEIGTDRLIHILQYLTDASSWWASGWKFRSDQSGDAFIKPSESILFHKTIKDILVELRTPYDNVAEYRGMFDLAVPRKKAPRVGSTQFGRLIYRTPFGTYEPERQLGQGGNAVVWLASDTAGNQVAIKVLRPGVTTQNSRRFRNELSFCQQAQNPHVVRVLDFGIVPIDDDTTYSFLVMPYFPQTLRDLLKAGINAIDALSYFSQILNGMEAAHAAKVIHRDLKPENILYNPSERLLVIGDFGIAHFVCDDLYTAVETRDNERLANFIYAAPEQRVRGSTVDVAADIYALGLMLNEMFTGVVPQGTNFRTVGTANPSYAFLDPIVNRMVRHDPTERPASVREIWNEIDIRGKESSSREVLETLRKQEVIPQTTSDELAEHPPELRGVDNYESGILSLTLTAKVNPRWVHTFHEIGNHHYFSDGAGRPNTFQFQDDKVRVPVRPEDAQQIIEWFKEYLVTASATYKVDWIRHVREMEEREKENLKKRIRTEETRNTLLRNLKI